MFNQEPLKRCVQRHHPMRKQPDDHRATQVSGQVVPDQNQPQWWQWQMWARGPTRSPIAPAAAARVLRSARLVAQPEPATVPACSHGCRTTFGALVTPLARTWPVAGRNKVSSLAVPPRMYSCG